MKMNTFAHLTDSRPARTQMDRPIGGMGDVGKLYLKRTLTLISIDSTAH